MPSSPQSVVVCRVVVLKAQRIRNDKLEKRAVESGPHSIMTSLIAHKIFFDDKERDLIAYIPLK